MALHFRGSRAELVARLRELARALAFLATLAVVGMAVLVLGS